MASYLAEKYAYLLTKEDAKQLFESLATLLGSVSEAARECNIQSRKTIYDWKEASDIRLSTKTRVLDASLRNIPDETLNFLLERSEESTSDILHTILSRTYEIAMRRDLNKERFTELTNKFTLITKEHAGIVLERLEEEVGEMTQAIQGKAFELKMYVPPPSIETMKPARLLELLPTIMTTMPLRITQAEKLDLAQKFNVPMELIEVSSTIASMVSSRSETEPTNAASQVRYILPQQTMALEHRPPISEPVQTPLFEQHQEVGAAA